MFYNLLKIIVKILFKTIWKLNIEGTENIPGKGPLIIVANHSSLLDGFVMIAVFKFKLTFLSAAYLFDIPMVGFILKKLGAIPVSTKRKTVSSVRTVKKVSEILKNNGVLMIFPEGGIKGNNKINDIKAGAAYFSVKSKILVLPVAIFGTEQILPTGRIVPHIVGNVTVKIGNPIIPRDNIEDMSKLIVEHLNKLMDGEVK
ncbi:MAG: 1-acyl-sn-glycerol-3-phosphate acyltransferase [Clostridiales bacterium]|jgi:1-acyl-sn-glycerol-3-phosphate acyltransferase|nr:1-acyl-sn-glycerol-3-phosphate acyltransferase [Clostridiales bacterium]